MGGFIANMMQKDRNLGGQGNLGEIGRAGGNMPAPGGPPTMMPGGNMPMPGGNINPGPAVGINPPMGVPPIGTPGGTNLPGGPGGAMGMGRLDPGMLRKILQNPRNPTSGPPPPVSTDRVGGMAPTPSPSPTPTDSVQPPNMRAGRGIMGASRPGQNPRVRRGRGFGLNMF